MDESKNHRASMHSKERLPWVPRAIRPYESSASSLAKLAFLSLSPSHEFWSTDYWKIGAPADWFASDTFNFSKDQFIELTGEQPRRLWLQTFDSNRFPSRILRIKDIDSVDFSRFRFCERCLSEGFHSTLHQLKWLDRCFVHGDALVQHQRLTGPHQWRDLAMLLYRTWFKREGPWADALNPLRWGQVESPRVLRRLQLLRRWSYEQIEQVLT